MYGKLHLIGSPIGNIKDVSLITIEAIKNAPINAKYIAVDLRNYKKVNLGNIIIANINSKLISLVFSFFKKPVLSS